MLANILQRHQPFQPVVLTHPGERLLPLDFTAANTSLTTEILDQPTLFSEYVSNLLAQEQCNLGIGGYAEHRTIYARKAHFQTGTDEPRLLHLGVDIWGAAGTPVYAPLNGTVHSFRFNNQHGDYGPTIILQHQLEGYTFHTLYGHLSLPDLDDLYEGRQIAAGELIAHFGALDVNGNWPPHLHFQLIIDMEGNSGDYPGVCRYSQRERYLSNCPDPNLILHLL
jgi:peptidoglycan LD-endopeptidase LytH